ncbi:MAG: zf-HC2 domain-containing protein [Myxococcaceae bacterium]|nr:zf-HC2 domain-containing protein [Myxococcaceae bacterium]
MKPQSLHAHEDRLLDFAYGELPPQEARVVESHLEGCSRCSELLDGIRGVRTTMAQLPMEPAPDAGLESLFAYAQQAARNAAAGPPPKPTWWRRWLVPVMGVAAVSLFGILSTQVNEAVELRSDLAMKSEQDAAPAALPAMPVPAQAAPMANAPPPPAEPMAGLTPPQSAPPAKLDKTFLRKDAPSQKEYALPAQGARADWSNAGSLDNRALKEERSRDNLDDTFVMKSVKAKKKSGKSYEYDRRDAMTQSGAFPKPKPVLAGAAPGGAAAAPSTPAPAQEPAAPPAMDEESGAEGLMAEAQAQQEAPSRGSLRVGGSVGRATEAESAEQPADGDQALDMVAAARPSESRREQVQLGAAEPSAPPAPASTSMPSVRTAPSKKPPAKRAEERGASSSDLSRQAEAAFRSRDRVQEVQLLRQALAAGASGKERLGLLNRLCDAEFAIGRRQAAIEACTLVLKEDPRSSAAQVARGRLRREAPQAGDANAGPGSRDTSNASEMKAPAPAAPAEAY